jgi:hypothetical protein
MVANCYSAMKDNKQRSSKVLMILILVMYINQSALVAVIWYLGWLAYVKHSGSEDQATAIFLPSEETPLTVLNITAVTTLLVTLKLGIADSIMVVQLIFCLFSNSNQLLRSGAVGSSVIGAGEQQLFEASM